MKLDQVIQVNLSIGMGSGGADRDDEMTVKDLLAYGDHAEEEYIDGGWSAK